MVEGGETITAIMRYNRAKENLENAIENMKECFAKTGNDEILAEAKYKTIKETNKLKEIVSKYLERIKKINNLCGIIE